MVDLATAMQRIYSSKKVIYAAVPIFANVVAGFFGMDPTSKMILVIDAAFAMLLIIQGFLDIKFGSPSDSTELPVASVVPAEPVAPVMMMRVTPVVPEKVDLRKKR
jgi:hypothetical protein